MEFLRIFTGRALFVAVLSLLVVGASGCEGEKKSCEKTFSCKLPPKQDRMLQGKEFLSNFKGDRAREVFLLVDEEHQKYRGEHYCPAVYGVVLADMQRATKNLNTLLGLAADAIVGASPKTVGFAPASLGDGINRYTPSAAEGQDFGNLLENGWSSMEPILTELSNYSTAVTYLAKTQDCEFSIGLDEDYKSGLPENPYKFVLNLGNSELPVVQLVFRARFDGSEARLFNGMSRTLLGAANLLLAHEYKLTINLAKILYQLGFPVAECISQDLLSCSQSFSPDTSLIMERILGWAFLFEDNPTFLARHENFVDTEDPETEIKGRWERRFPYVDDEWEAGFYALRTFLPSLVARTFNQRGKDGAAQRLSEYFVLYQDDNENDEIDSLDKFGLNIQKIKLDPEFFIVRGSMSEVEAAKMRKSFDDIEAAINSTLLGILKSFEPSARSVGEINTFIERMYKNMHAVDNPDAAYEPIPIDSFNTVFQDFLLGFFSGDLPNFMDFDLRSYFVDPVPFRNFVPRWHRITIYEEKPGAEPLEIRLAEFLLDSDDYAFSTTTTGAPLHPTNMAEYLNKVIWPSGTPLYSERATFEDTYNGGTLGTLTNIGWPSDCLNGQNLTSTLSSSDGPIAWPVLYLNLPDPTFNGMININLSAWDPYYDEFSGNGKACPNDPAGRLPATNYSLSKAMWMYADYFVDHFEILSLLGVVGVSPQAVDGGK